MGPGSKKRKLNSKVEEVNFDDTARYDFLTGFRKRKQQRIKHAQSVAEKRAREERIEDRKRVREERAAEFKQVMEQHRKQLQRIKDEETSGSSDSNPDQDDESDQEWEGFAEPPAVDYEAEYIDEDKYTTVTVEEMDPSREGLRKSVHHDDSDEETEDEQNPSAASATEPEPKPTKKARKPSADKPKKKKQQFRYESKGERKLARAKQRLSNSKKAQARRER